MANPKQEKNSIRINLDILRNRSHDSFRRVVDDGLEFNLCKFFKKMTNRRMAN